MKMKDVVAKTNLTKKAIDYYCEKGLIHPKIEENGYRTFSQEDIDTLGRISLYRKLGLTLTDIQKVVNDPTSIGQVAQNHALHVQHEQDKQKILEALTKGENIERLKEKITALTVNFTINQKLLDVFPGHFGLFLSLQFSHYLHEEMVTEEQQLAFKEIVEFLDNVPDLSIPSDFKKHMNEQLEVFTASDFKKIVANVDTQLQKQQVVNEEAIDFMNRFIEYQNSKEYMDSPAYKWKQIVQHFCETNGYYDIFIPAMRRLSPSYHQYYKNLIHLNEDFPKSLPPNTDFSSQ